MEKDIKHRCYKFSPDVIKYLRKQKWDQFSLVIVKQLIRSSISVGANVVEAKNSSTRVIPAVL